MCKKKYKLFLRGDNILEITMPLNVECSKKNGLNCLELNFKINWKVMDIFIFNFTHLHIVLR